MRTCPRCALVCPDESLRCDCGYYFVGETSDSHGAELHAARRRAHSGILRGLVIAGVALGFSIWSFVVASPGGRFWIAHGGIIAGLALAGGNWSMLARLKEARADGPTKVSK